MLALLLLLLAGDVLPPPPPGEFSLRPPKTTTADGGVVSCQTVNECWLAPDGSPMPRPARFKKKPLPKGDCGKNLLWLRNRLTCEENVCKSTYMGDAC
ncbi:MAG: hypothetical protein JNM17_25545 [Archangium sp.]|nr:hypothetical protein [Archangium sp.]